MVDTYPHSQSSIQQFWSNSSLLCVTTLNHVGVQNSKLKIVQKDGKGPCHQTWVQSWQSVLSCPCPRPEEHGGRITDTCLFLLLLYYKITVLKDWSLNSHLLNLVLTEIRKNPSSTVYSHKAQLIWKPFPRPYSAAREDPSISVQSHHCWSWRLLDRTIGRLQFKNKGQVTGWNAAFPLFSNIFLRIVGTLTYHLLCDEK